MKRIVKLLSVSVIAALCLCLNAKAADGSDHWRLRFDLGGVLPEDADLTEFQGPVGDGRFRLSAGFQYDMSLEYRVTRWLEVGPELGFTLNGVDSVGDWSHGNSILFQLLMMANAVVTYPTDGPWVPFAGAGVGGAASFLTFGGGAYDDGYWEPDGTASDLVLAVQAFGGLRYRIGENLELGLIYRFLVTNPQHWNVDWWDGSEFDIGIDSLRMHSICLILSGSF